MSEPSVKPSASQPVKDKRLMKATFMLVLYSLGLIGVLAAAGCFGYRLFHGPQAKPMTEIAPTKKVIPAFSTILATSAPAPELPKQIQVTLAQMAKVEAAKQARPGGPLYDPASGNVEMFFEKLPLMDPQVAEAQSVLAKYLQAATWRERLPYIFEPERVKALMQVQYEKRGQKDPEHEALLAAGLITAGTSKMLNLQFACTTQPAVGMRANFHRTRSGKLLLDWESWAAWGDKTWPEFKEQRSQLPVLMRVVASESSYYNYEFNENWRWLAVKLHSPDRLQNVTGYVERKSMLGIALANLIGVPLPHKLPDGTPIPALKLPGSKALVTVRLAFPNNAQSDHCVKITDLLADRWLLFPGEVK